MIELDDATTVAHHIDASQLAFVLNSGSANAVFVYTPGDGALYYDPDGGAQAFANPILIAILLNHPATFSAADLWLI